MGILEIDYICKQLYFKKKMKLTITFIILLLSTISAFSQIPFGYYADAQGLSGEELKSTLYDIIKGHTAYPYTDVSTDVWDILKETDKDPNNEDNVILVYTGWSVNAAQEWNDGDGWNREHVWSRSHGDFDYNSTPGTDVHHIRPCDPSVNSAKNSRWFDYGTYAYYDNGIYTGCYTSSTDWVWEPRDEVKGDIARMIFYMATRYEGFDGEPDLELVDYLPEDNYTSDPIYAKLSTLIEWNNIDPVDAWEQNRNDIIYYDYQHNRNPYIDHPEFVELIWANNLEISNNSELKIIVSPNPTSGIIQIDGNNIENIQVLNLNGNIFYKGMGNSIDISNNPKGIYYVRITTHNKVFTRKIVLI